MRRRSITLGLCVGAIILATVGTRFGLRAVLGTRRPQSAVPSDTPVPIRPDYTDLVIPPNIAPLNFVIEEAAAGYFVQIHGPNGKAIGLATDDGQVRIPLRSWRALLGANRGGEIWFDIYTADDSNRWHRRPRIVNRVAAESIDSHVVYRLLRSQYNYFKHVSIHQRDLESFKTSVIVDGRDFRDGCVNCHSFLNHDPSRMLLGTRSAPFGSAAIQVDRDRVTKLGTKFGHTTWHPSGKFIAYSIYDVRQFFHTARLELRDVIEFDSLVAGYDGTTQQAVRIEALADKRELETHPCWAPDGKHLYYASAPMPWPDKNTFPPAEYAEAKYSIKRIAYDLPTNTWGSVETVVSAEQTGRSCLTPRPSPDGRFLLFVMCDYSCFGLFAPHSDLYMMDLASGDYWQLECNSVFAESWHCWSSNGRWVLFSSKRPTGLFTRLYIAHIDVTGHASKAFVLPQEDPHFYDGFARNYNVPELVRGPVRVNRRALLHTIRGEPDVAVAAVTGATPKAGRNTAPRRSPE